MRKKCKYAGMTVKVKPGVGLGIEVKTERDLSGLEFEIEDWCENVIGCSWMEADGNPAALEYAIRTALHGKKNNVPIFSNDVVYGKIGPFSHLFHLRELELPKEV